MFYSTVLQNASLSQHETGTMEIWLCTSDHQPVLAFFSELPSPSIRARFTQSHGNAKTFTALPISASGPQLQRFKDSLEAHWIKLDGTP